MTSSDFSLIPLKYKGRAGWGYREATWPLEIEAEVHRFIDGEREEEITYIRKRNHDGLIQSCKIRKQDGMNIVDPGDGYYFEIKRETENNKEIIDINIDNESVPHEMECLICMENKRTYVVPKCFHVIACARCAQKLENTKCPICRIPIIGKLQKLYF